MFLPEFTINVRVKMTPARRKKLAALKKARNAELKALKKLDDAEVQECETYADYAGDSDEGRDCTESKKLWEAAKARTAKLAAELNAATATRKKCENALLK